jgi:hypothetical protein
MAGIVLRQRGCGPTPDALLFAWWRASLAGENPPIHEEEPQCGYFRTRVVKGGVPVGARIYCRQTVNGSGFLLEDEALVCQIGGQGFGVETAWSWLCKNPIKKSEYLFLVEQAEWAKRFDKTSPHASPFKPIDYATVKLPNMPKRKRKR